MKNIKKGRVMFYPKGWATPLLFSLAVLLPACPRQEIPAGQSCQAHADCANDQVCEQGLCRQTCNSGLDCPDGQDCHEGFCLPVTSVLDSGVSADTLAAFDANQADVTGTILDASVEDLVSLDLRTWDQYAEDSRFLDASPGDAEHSDQQVLDRAVQDLHFFDATAFDAALGDQVLSDISLEDSALPDVNGPDNWTEDSATPDACCDSGVCTGFDQDPQNCGGCGIVCDDGDACTDNLCIQGHCSYVSLSGAPCLAEIGHFYDGATASAVVVQWPYCYVADNNDGLEILDVSAPSDPYEVGQVSGIGQIYDVAVQGSYAYIAGYSGFRVVDVHDPASPTVVHHNDLSRIEGAVSVAGNFAYVTRDTAGVDIYDISTPTAPVVVGNFMAPSSYACDVKAVGNIAYLAYGQYGFTAANIAEPSAPVELAGAHVDFNYLLYGIDVAGNYAYLTDRNLGLIVLDITDLSAPAVVGAYDSDNWGLMVQIVGSCAYFANDWGGVKVLDISNPAEPTLITSFSAGSRTNHVFVQGNDIYLADGGGGVRILKAHNLPCH